MGFLRHLLFWPVTGPLFLADFSLGKVQDVVRDELTDDGQVKAALLELQLKLELGDIDDDQYRVEEAALMQQLRDVRRWREEFGLAVSGGPVRVQGAEPAESGGAGSGERDAADDPQPSDPGSASVELNLDWD